MKFEITWKVNKQPDKLAKYIEKELAPELREKIYDIIAVRGNLANNSVYSAKEFIRDKAGLFTQAALKEFIQKGMIQEGSRVITNSNNSIDSLEFEAELREEFKDKFQNDPIPYILKQIGNFTPTETSKIFDDVVEKAEKKLEREESDEH